MSTCEHLTVELRGVRRFCLDCRTELPRYAPAAQPADVDRIMALHDEAVGVAFDMPDSMYDADARAALRAEVERLAGERDDFKAKWYQSNRDLHAAWERAERAERALAEAQADAKRLREALQKIDAACALIPEGMEGYLEPLSDALADARIAMKEGQ